MINWSYYAAKLAETPHLSAAALKLFLGVVSGSIDPKNKSECARQLGVSRPAIYGAFKSLKAAGFDPEAESEYRRIK